MHEKIRKIQTRKYAKPIVYKTCKNEQKTKYYRQLNHPIFLGPRKIFLKGTIQLKLTLKGQYNLLSELHKNLRSGVRRKSMNRLFFLNTLYINFSMVFATYFSQKLIFLTNFFTTDLHFSRRVFWCISCPYQEFFYI